MILGCKAMGRARDHGRFNPNTGVGRVEAHKGHYADALRKGTTVDALLSNPFGGLAPATLAHLFQLDRTAKSTRGRDRTVIAPSTRVLHELDGAFLPTVLQAEALLGSRHLRCRCHREAGQRRTPPPPSRHWRCSRLSAHAFARESLFWLGPFRAGFWFQGISVRKRTCCWQGNCARKGLP